MESQTKAHNVDIIDEHFYIPQLDRHRRIWLYRPTDYYYTEKKYTVIYMHDGQNLFDEATAFGGEWAIDKTLNTMIAECIIVAIDNSEHRLTEYNYNDTEYGAGEGRQYIDFIVNTLKPFIDRNFRTNPRRENTYIAGSSMGGLISLYGAIHYPEIFGGAGIFSPSLWLAPNATDELKPLAKRNFNYPQRFYFYGGGKEGQDMVEHIAAVAGMLDSYMHCQVNVEINSEGEHNEFCWRYIFSDYYSWLAQDFVLNQNQLTAHHPQLNDVIKDLLQVPVRRISLTRNDSLAVLLDWLSRLVGRFYKPSLNNCNRSKPVL